MIDFDSETPEQGKDRRDKAGPLLIAEFIRRGGRMRRADVVATCREVGYDPRGYGGYMHGGYLRREGDVVYLGQPSLDWIARRWLRSHA